MQTIQNTLQQTQTTLKKIVEQQEIVSGWILLGKCLMYSIVGILNFIFIAGLTTSGAQHDLHNNNEEDCNILIYWAFTVSILLLINFIYCVYALIYLIRNKTDQIQINFKYTHGLSIAYLISIIIVIFLYFAQNIYECGALYIWSDVYTLIVLIIIIIYAVYYLVNYKKDENQQQTGLREDAEGLKQNVQ